MQTDAGKSIFLAAMAVAIRASFFAFLAYIVGIWVLPRFVPVAPAGTPVASLLYLMVGAILGIWYGSNFVARRAGIAAPDITKSSVIASIGIVAFFLLITNLEVSLITSVGGRDFVFLNDSLFAILAIPVLFIAARFFLGRAVRRDAPTG